MFEKKKEMPDPQVLPLSQDALKVHITRANFQTMGWKNALSHHSAPLNLNNQGWRMDESIEIRWMNQKPAPEILEELISCCCCKKQTLKCASLSVQNSCLRIFVIFLKYDSNCLEEDYDKLSDEDDDGKMKGGDDIESKLDDNTVLSGIDNSDEDE